MTNVLVPAATAYRMVDVLRNYADILDTERNGSLGPFARRAADQIEAGKRVGLGLIEVEQFDIDAAHSATVAVMVDRRERAEALKAQATELDAEAGRLEEFLGRVF